VIACRISRIRWILQHFYFKILPLYAFGAWLSVSGCMEEGDISICYGDLSWMAESILYNRFCNMFFIGLIYTFHIFKKESPLFHFMMDC